jgi:hypothetical protein
MSLSSSPSFEDPETRIQDSEINPNNPHPQRRLTFRVLIGVFGVIAVGLAALNILGGVERYGAVAGVILDLNDNPVQAEVFVLGADNIALAGPDGSFTLEDVPVGGQQLIVGYNGIGQSLNVSVANSEVTQVGLVRIDTSLEDG